MPHHKSSVKRVRQDKKRTQANKVKTTQARTAIKRIHSAVEAGDKEAAQSGLTKAQSLLARLAKKGIIKKNSAARRTARLAKAVSRA